MQQNFSDSYLNSAAGWMACCIHIPADGIFGGNQRRICADQCIDGGIKNLICQHFLLSTAYQQERNCTELLPRANSISAHSASLYIYS